MDPWAIDRTALSKLSDALRRLSYGNASKTIAACSKLEKVAQSMDARLSSDH